MKKIVYMLLLFLIPSFLYGEQLVFKYFAGSKYRIIVKVSEKVYIDGEYSHSAEIWNKAAIEHIKVEGGKGFVSAVFQVSERAESQGQIFRLDEEHKASYWMDAQGRYEVNQNYLFPLMRDVPLFPEKKISPGDTWKAEGIEVHDFRRYMIQMPVHVPVTVNYEYVKNETMGKSRVAKLKLNYQIYRELPELLHIPGKHPLLIYGKVEQAFYWDMTNGRPHSYDDTFDIIYVFNDNQMYEFVGTSRGELFESPEMDKEKIKDEIEKTIEKEDIKNTSVTSDDDGVSIILEDINFSPESDTLLPKEQEKLKKIAGILKRYPERDLIVGGHTALAGTEEGRQVLSEKRAKTVGEFLQSHGVKNNMLFKGFGARIPVADNSTENGMKKNRRVEIKILEN
ncbi:MAG: OmpA family protein [Spirochaetales bacterium]|nr:OmpA family protein [Spirochaetales bacterium]